MSNYEEHLDEFKAIRNLFREDNPTHSMMSGTCTAVLAFVLMDISGNLGRIADALEKETEVSL
ncbi:MAG TPA: hypothetical protein DD473_04605 [Planctomycetaceae bacterium]|nr:hypothetical protein [Planctomycetaceae bacterium]